MAYWIGKVLITNDEKEAISILRMLDCGSRVPADILIEKENYNVAEAVKIMHQIISIDITDDDARSVLYSYNVSKDNVEEIIKLSRCNPPEDYFITSEDMVDKGGVWGHFGSWNFNKAQAYFDIMKGNVSDKADGIQHIMN